MAKCDKIRIIMVEYSKNLGGNYMGIYCKNSIFNHIDSAFFEPH